jgi:arylsulfatase A-like enzyme
MPFDLNRRTFLGVSGASLLSCATSALAAAPVAGTAGSVQAEGRTSSRPNLIFFIPDEMRADALACYGNPIVKTPNFDKLAAQGTRFSNCHVQFPVCGASRCSLMTGWPASVRGHRSLYYFLRPDEPNMLRYLKDAGYETLWFGGHNDALAAQTFYSSLTEWMPGPRISSAAGPDRGPYGLTPGAYSMLYPPSGDRRSTGDYALVEAVIHILQRKEQDRPFAIFLPLIEPHPPYTISQDFYDMYSPASVPAPVPWGLPKKPSFHAGIREAYGLTRLSEATFRKLRAVYYGQVSYSDWLLGELMEALEKSGKDNQTAIFLLSDHGDYTGDYGLIEKWPSGLEDCLTHVPLIVRMPGGRQGHVSEDMVELYDVMATAIELAGTRTNHTHFARSLVPQLDGQSGDPNRAAFAEGGYNVYEPQCFEPAGAGGGPYTGKIALQNQQPQTVSRAAMVRTRTHKLIVRPQGQSELYASVDDPHEMRNLIDERSIASMQSKLAFLLMNHFVETTGIAPMDKDPRETPPYYPTRADLPPTDWHTAILDL